MYLKIHPFERPEHGLKHSEDEVGPTEEGIEHGSGKHPEGKSDTIELLDHGSDEHREGRVEHQEHNLDHGSDDHLGGVVEIQEHNLDTNLDELLEKAEPKQGVGLETLELSVCVFSKRSSQRPETKKKLKLKKYY